MLATFGVVAATFLIGLFSWNAFVLVGLNVPIIYCLLFGTLISATDPIAVLGVLKQASAPKSLEAKIAGESLFNHCVAVVMFLLLARIAAGGTDMSASEVLLIFSREAIDGILFGLGAGGLTYWMLKSVANFQVEILLTLALSLPAGNMRDWGKLRHRGQRPFLQVTRQTLR